jgi:predicted NBD/HSP70 family sugar kinase
MAQSLLRVIPKIPPKLDPDFRPAYLGHKNFISAVKKSGQGVPLQFALERSSGVISRYDTLCFASSVAGSEDNLLYAERVLKYLLWARGGFRVFVNAPKDVLAFLQKAYSPKGSRAFDADFFAGVYEAKKFEVVGCDAKKMPKSNESSQPIGRHLEGCRIGFDAGGSDRKVAAVIDGKQVFTTETVWEPKIHSDPQYHINGINDSIAKAAAHMPRVDAIGVSSAGIFVDNRCMVASLFRKVPKKLFNQKIKNVFLDVAKKWGNVPIVVANDGDVTALAGSMSLNDNAVLGIAMGTSQAVGYVDKLGHVTGWLNELAFAPVDYAENAPADNEWSGDLGTGVNYFSQDAVIRLAGKLGIKFKAKDAPGAKLKAVQNLLKRGDAKAKGIFETIGVYLGYAILQYAEFYSLKHVLILGRVTSGQGGNIVLAQCKKTMAAEDPGVARKVSVNLPDEASRRVGQAIAAASLPQIKKMRITQPKKKAKQK